jgi:hypothetical protein
MITMLVDLFIIEDVSSFCCPTDEIQQIIDGFGSYVDDFMQCDVFRGIGGVANKYYLLFQHHLAPPMSSYTSDNGLTQSTHNLDEDVQDAPQRVAPGGGIDPRQLEDTFVLEEKTIDSGYIIGPKPGVS